MKNDFPYHYCAECEGRKRFSFPPSPSMPLAVAEGKAAKHERPARNATQTPSMGNKSFFSHLESILSYRLYHQSTVKAAMQAR